MKLATEIVIGDMVVEADGAFFEVSSISRSGRQLVFNLKNVNAYMIAATEARVSSRAMVRVMEVA